MVESRRFEQWKIRFTELLKWMNSLMHYKMYLLKFGIYKDEVKKEKNFRNSAGRDVGI